MTAYRVLVLSGIDHLLLLVLLVVLVVLVVLYYVAACRP